MGEIIKAPTQFLTNEKGEKIAVVLSIEEYEKILEELEDLEDIRACDEVKALGETPISLEQALEENRRHRK
jgi:hypothetical protein